MTSVGDLGEFGLIERLTRRLAGALPADLVVGPGDDAAAWRAGDGYAVATTDTLVAGVHFLPGRVAWRDVGWKALAVNVSDIAAMGATPRFALVTLAPPRETAVAEMDDLYDGLRACAEAFGVTVAGGDIVTAPVFSITVALLGEGGAAADGAARVLRRDAARPGDIVAVTGALGGAAGGVRALADDVAPSPEGARLIARQMRPQPRIDAGRAAVEAGVRCGIDVSDGLLQDLGHICEASGVAAVVQLASLPVDADVAAVYPDDALRLAATGGEDYELLLVAPAAAINAAGRSVHVTVIGEIVAPGADGRRVHCVDAGGETVAFDATGWDHLAAHGGTG